MKKNFSYKAINRLTLYHNILNDYLKRNIKTISSSKIAKLLKVDDSQVRRDIGMLKNVEKSHLGYISESLKKAIELTLGFERPKDVFIIGAGNLGFALAKYRDFANYGLNVLALFDNDALKVDMTINEKQVHHISKLPQLSQSLNVDIAILTVPSEVAQMTTDFLVKSKIKYIWNFTPVVLTVPSEVQVWTENLMGNFLHFTYQGPSV